MARTVTLTELRTRVRDRADIEGATGFLTDARVNEYINSSIAALWDMLLESMGHDFYVTMSTITLLPSVDGLYSLPADFYIMRRVEVLQGEQAFPIRPITMHTLRRYDNDFLAPVYRALDAPDSGYRLVGTVSATTGVYTPQIWLPKNWTGTLRIYYCPHAPVLDAEGDVWDGFNGWEEWVILDAAIKVAMKQERDPSDLYAARERVELRIRSLANARDMTHGEVIAETEFF